MSRLMPFDAQTGLYVRIEEKLYVIHAVVSGTSFLVLSAVGASNELRISRNELASLVCMDKATFVDELEAKPNIPKPSVAGDKPAEPPPPAIDVARLSPERIADWVGKVFIARRLLRHRGSSYKSRVFAAVISQANDCLDAAMKSPPKRWSAVTLYHDLLRLRKMGYVISAFQRKGVEYVRHTNMHKALEPLKKRLTEELKANPHRTIRQIANAVGVPAKGKTSRPSHRPT